MSDIHYIHTYMLGQRRHGLELRLGLGLGLGMGFRIRIRIRIEWNGVGLVDDANVGKER